MKIFLSCQSEDRQVAAILHRELVERGHVVAFFPDSLDDPVPEIAKHLRSADLLLLVCGRRAEASPWVAAEVLAGETRGIPILTVLVDRQSQVPRTLRPGTAVLSYPRLARTGFRTLDIFPSRTMVKRYLEATRRKLSPYVQRRVESLPEPILERDGFARWALQPLAYVSLLASYLAGMLFPIIVLAIAWAPARSMDKILELLQRHPIYLVLLLAAFTLLLFSSPSRRLAYPLWVFWFVRDYLHALWASREPMLKRRFHRVMESLRARPANTAFWEVEAARRGGNPIDSAEPYNLLDSR